MKKYAVIFHGYPSMVSHTHSLSIMLHARGYQCIQPNIFALQKMNSDTSICEKFNNICANITPNLIIGISMGGLLMPIFAKKFPSAKLLFIASGTQLRPRSLLFPMVFSIITSPVGSILHAIVKHTPKRLIVMVYKQMNQTKLETTQQIYDEDMNENIKNILTIPYSVQQSLATLLFKIHNDMILKTLKNNALILYGTNDKLMPPEESFCLHRYLENSTLIKTKGAHFDVINNETCPKINAFI